MNDKPVLYIDESDPHEAEAGLEKSTDYVLNPEAKSVWITVENISVYIKRGDEGVSVDLYARHKESSSPIVSTYALFSEAENCYWCGGKGFAVATVYGDITYRELQKCDECQIYKTDEDAEIEARLQGLDTAEAWDKYWEEQKSK